jgi:hypothetical protein
MARLGDPRGEARGRGGFYAPPHAESTFPQAHGERMRIRARFSPFLLKSTPEKTARMSQQTGSKTTLTVGPGIIGFGYAGLELSHGLGTPACPCGPCGGKKITRLTCRATMSVTEHQASARVLRAGPAGQRAREREKDHAWAARVGLTAGPN